jgi:hypothetical protein
MLKKNSFPVIKASRKNSLIVFCVIIICLTLTSCVCTPYLGKHLPVNETNGAFEQDQVNASTDGTSFGCGTPPVGSGSLFQIFTPSASSVAAVDVLLRAGGSFPQKGYSTTIKIRSNSVDGKVLGTATTLVPGPQKVGAQALVRFRFSPPLALIAGNNYVIEWIAPKEGGVVLTWMGTPNDSYIGGSTLDCNGDPTNPSRDLYFVTYYMVQLIFHADFDADAVGQSPYARPAGPPLCDAITLKNVQTGGNFIRVHRPGSGFTTRSLRIHKESRKGNSPIFEGHPDPAFGPYKSGTYTVTWKSLSEQSNGQYGFAAVVDPTNLSTFTVNYASDGTIKLQDGSGTIGTGMTYAADVPQTFQAIIDLDNRDFDLFIGGVRVGFKRSFQYKEFTHIDRFFWEIGGTITETYAIDDIKIERGITLTDSDGDGVLDESDNCLHTFNFDQADSDLDEKGKHFPDGIGDVPATTAPMSPTPGKPTPTATAWGMLVKVSMRISMYRLPAPLSDREKIFGLRQRSQIRHRNPLRQSDRIALTPHSR